MEVGDRRERLASRPARVVIGACVGNALGVVVGALVMEWLDPGPPDMSMEMLIGMCIGGGVGWVIGAAIGWIGGRNRPPPRWTTRVALVALITPVMWLGLAASGEARHSAFGPMIDDAGPWDPRRDRLAFTIAVDTTIAVVTLVAMAAYVPRQDGSDRSA